MRPDILALGVDALVDLTNRGTVRRALRDLDESLVECTVAVQGDDADVVVEASDGTRCDLTAGRAFPDWSCTCLAAGSCRHVVRAVLACQRQAGDRPDTVDPPDAPAADAPVHPRIARDPSPAGPVAAEALWPGDITDEELRAALGRALPAAIRACAGGTLAVVAPGIPTAHSPGIAVVRLLHPRLATVRFLLGRDLRYTRCDCRDPDPCGHVAMAVLAARGVAHAAGSGLRSTPGDTWRADAAVLDAAGETARELLRVGIDAGHTALVSSWALLAERARRAELPALAAVAEEVTEELRRYAAADARFGGGRTVALLGELLARAHSLRGGGSEPLPARLVAGVSGPDVQIGQARLIGLGTELVDRDGRCTVRAVLADQRSGVGLTVTRTVDDAPADRPAHRIAAIRVGGAPVSAWGAGQTVLSGARREVSGQLFPGRGRVSVLPGTDLEALGPPQVARSVAELGAQLGSLPRAVDDRRPSRDVVAARFERVHAPRFDRAAQAVHAVLVDSESGSAEVWLPYTARQAAGVTALEQLLAAAEREGSGLWVSGRWRATASGPVVTPMLVGAAGEWLQPQVAPPTTTGAEPAPPPDHLPDTPDPRRAVLARLEGHLAEVVVAGLGRMRRDGSLRAWAGVADGLEEAGALRWAALARRVADADPAREEGRLVALEDLLVHLVIAAPLL